MGAHLLAVVVSLLVVFVGVGAYIGRDTWQNAQRGAQADAASFASVAADALADNAEIVRTLVASASANPGVAARLAQPAECGLQFELELFPTSHLDLVLPDGRIACTSAVGPALGDHGGAPWLADLAAADELFEAGPFLDGVTGENAIVVAVAVDGADGQRLGGVVAVLPTAAVADLLADAFGSRMQYDFAVLDDRSGTVLSAADRLGDSNRPMEAAGYIWATSPVPGTSFSVEAGAGPDDVLAPARSVLVRGALMGAALILVLLAASAIVNRQIARPLRRLTRLVGDTGPYAAIALGEIRGPSEIARLASELGGAITARQEFETQLTSQARHDPLTGLANRALLAERLGHALEHEGRSDGFVGVLFVDLDRFKLVNDSLGHAVGDGVLIDTSVRLRAVLRADDTLARFGGDEFVILRDACSGLDELEALAAQVLEAVNAPLVAGDTIVRLTASVGIAASALPGGAADLVRDADAAMYFAKDEGRARAELFDGRLHRRASSRLALESDLQVALERTELRVVYQPKVDLRTGDFTGVEALLRWDHPALGLVAPDTFVPIAEDTGLMGPIGRFVLEAACRQAAAWQERGLRLTVAVNISGRQLADPEFASQIRTVLDEAGVAPAALCLELTETLLMSDTLRHAEQLHELHALGVRLSIDDFGTGYSSLAYLHRFPIDELKIDRAFVSGMIEHQEQLALVSAVVAMAKALGLSIVAEGVETDAQAQVLRELGCEAAQGYLYAKPLSPQALDALFAAAPGRLRRVYAAQGRPAGS